MVFKPKNISGNFLKSNASNNEIWSEIKLRLKKELGRFYSFDTYEKFIKKLKKHKNTMLNKYNHKVKIDDATNAVKNVNNGALSELAELAPSIAGVWDKIDAKREKDGKAFGQMLHFKYGITAQDYGDQQGIRGHLKEKAGANNSLRNKMRERGASWAEIEQASRLNGYERLGLYEGIAIRGGRDYGAFDNAKYTTVYELGNGLGRHSKASAIYQGNGEALAAVNQRLLSEYIQLPQFQGIDTTLFVTHAREKILNYQARSVTAQH